MHDQVCTIANFTALFTNSSHLDVSTSTMEVALRPLQEHLTCDLCRDTLKERIKDVIVQWSIVKVRVTLVGASRRLIVRHAANYIADSNASQPSESTIHFLLSWVYCDNAPYRTLTPFHSGYTCNSSLPLPCYRSNTHADCITLLTYPW